MSNDWLTPEVVAAVKKHMNDDHQADSLVMVSPLCPGAVAAKVIGLDRDALHLEAVVADQPRPVRVDLPWPSPLTERADIRRYVVQLYEAAGGAPRDHVS